MHTIPYLQEILRQEIENLQLPASPAELYEPIRYSISIGGKRIRPLLVLLACDLFDGNMEKILPAAIGLEIFHNFTLVHDDIMDNAPVRRGQPTVYRKWGINTAILAGDTMLSLAYENLTKIDPEYLPAVLSVFNHTVREVCEGQQYDMNFENEESIAPDDYLKMIRLKTAVLLGCCLKVGALAAGAGIKDTDNLYRFGENLGLAFQIQDDLLDTFGDESVFGKKTGGDINANKKTWLLVKALEIASPEQRDKLLQYYLTPSPDQETKFLRVKGLFTELNIEESARLEISLYYNKALEFLKRISLPESKLETLRIFCDRVMNRTY